MTARPVRVVIENGPGAGEAYTVRHDARRICYAVPSRGGIRAVTYVPQYRRGKALVDLAGRVRLRYTGAAS